MEKKQQILDAAQQLFGHHGLKKVTTDDIARAAHVSKATIYNVYRNKQEILLDVVSQEMDELLARIEAAVNEESTVEGKLRAHLLTKIGTVHKLVNLHKVTSESMAEHWDQAPVLRDRFVAEEIRVVREILTDGVAREGLVIADVEITSRLLVVALKSLEYPWALDGTDLSVPDQVGHMLTIVLDGLRRRS
ncbi:MAG: TetR/AcrR family transcriptional regulator [bacterium]|nr:TetR/AcrR family transcriptional regulator [bacterium]